MPFVQLEKREKHSWGSAITKSNTPPMVFFTFLNCKMVPNQAKHHIFNKFKRVN